MCIRFRAKVGVNRSAMFLKAERYRGRERTGSPSLRRTGDQASRGINERRGLMWETVVVVGIARSHLAPRLVQRKSV